MSNDAETIEVFGKRKWYYSYGYFMVFDTVLHFLAAFLLLHYLWLVTYGTHFMYVHDPGYSQAMIVVSLGVVYMVAYGILCLIAAKYCRSRILKPVPVITIDAQRLVVDTLFESYAVDWNNVSGIRSGKKWALKFTAISLKSENAVYSSKHAPWTRLVFLRNKSLHKAPVILMPNSALEESQAFTHLDLKAYYESNQTLHPNALPQS